MYAALLKLNFFTGIYIAITACYLLFHFQNVRTAFFKGLPSVVTFTKLNWTCITTLLFPLFIKKSKDYFFSEEDQNWAPSKSKKMRNPENVE